MTGLSDRGVFVVTRHELTNYNVPHLERLVSVLIHKYMSTFVLVTIESRFIWEI